MWHTDCVAISQEEYAALIGNSMLSLSCSNCSNVSLEPFLPQQLQLAADQFTRNSRFHEFGDSVDGKIKDKEIKLEGQLNLRVNEL